jgi:hypothetical protein
MKLKKTKIELLSGEIEKKNTYIQLKTDLKKINRVNQSQLAKLVIRVMKLG